MPSLLVCNSPEAYFSLDHYSLMSNMRFHYRVNYAHAHIPSADLLFLLPPFKFLRMRGKGLGPSLPGTRQPRL